MPTPTKTKKTAPAPAQEPPAAYIEAQVMGREINPEFLVLRVPDAELGWRRARLRVPKRLIHCFKKTSTIRVRPTDDPMTFEPFPSIL